MKKQLILLLLTVCAAAKADPVEVDGIWYNLIEKGHVAEVTKSQGDAYTGDIVIPESFTYKGVTYTVTSIGSWVFNSDVTSVVTPNTIRTIGEGAFACTTLKNVSLSNSLTTIGSRAFRSTKSLTSLIIPSSVTKIESYAFEESGLISITIPNGSIEEYAFYNCKSLKEVSVNGKIGQAAFAGCTNLNIVNIGEGTYTIYPWAFSRCSSLNAVNFGKYVNTIAYKAFADCTSLSYVSLPDNVQKIYCGAFYGCSNLATVIIGSGIQEIGVYDRAGSEGSFENCPKLSDVYCYANWVPSTRSNTFERSYPDFATLHVPDDYINSYQTSDPWSQFGKIVGLDNPDVKKCDAPTISYMNGQLQFYSNTAGAQYHYEITSEDIKGGWTSDGLISLAAAYKITAFATAANYSQSDNSEAMLYWVKQSGSLSRLSSINNEEMRGVIVNSKDGLITISGLDEKENVSFYTLDGKLLGRATAQNGSVEHMAMSEKVVVAKIGDSSIKVLVR
jgi:hypothetical protein